MTNDDVVGDDDDDDAHDEVKTLFSHHQFEAQGALHFTTSAASHDQQEPKPYIQFLTSNC